MTKKPSDIKIKVTSENKCSFCPGTICCSYFTEQLSTPRAKSDFDHMLWQISHQDTHIYKDEDGWYLLVDRPCIHLNKDGSCGNYENRMQVCRDYSNDFCEMDEPATKGFELYFDDYFALLKYCKQRFKTWDSK